MNKLKPRSQFEFPRADQHIHRLQRMVVITITMLLLICIIWSSIYQIPIYSVAVGEVESSQSVQRIEAGVSGKISKVYVEEGNEVQAGQKLLLIKNDVETHVHQSEVHQLVDYNAQLERLNALLEDRLPVFSQQLLKAYPKITAYQLDQYKIDKSAMTQSYKLLDQNLKLVEEEIRMIEPLVQQGRLARIELMKLQNKRNEIKAQMATFLNRFKQSFAKQRSDLIIDMKSLEHTIKIAQASMKETTVLAPSSGIIHNLKGGRLGDIVSIGELLCEIIPVSRDLYVEAYIPASKVGFIKAGMPVSIRVDAYEYAVWGDVPGTLISVSPDNIVSKNGSRSFKLIIELKHVDIKKREHVLELKPGMTVTANIKTNQMSLLQYIFKPFVKIFRHGLMEW